MPNLRGTSPINRNEGSHSYATQTIGRKKAGVGHVMGTVKSSARPEQSQGAAKDRCGAWSRAGTRREPGCAQGRCPGRAYGTTW